MKEIGIDKAFEMRDAIIKKAKATLESNGQDTTSSLVNAASVGIYEVLLSYLTQEQMDRIVEIHKLEL